MALEFGGLYLQNGATAQTLSTSNSKMTGWTTAQTGSKTIEGFPGVSPDIANDKITVDPGIYLVMVNVSGQLNPAAVRVQLAVFAAAVQQDNLQAEFESGGGATVTDVCFSCCGIIRTTAETTDLDVRLEAESGTPAFTPRFGQFTVLKL
jgi:hypothetical protein